MATGVPDYPSAAELAALIRARELSPVAAVETALARIEEVNPALNAFAFVYPEQALEAARAAETAVMRGEATGELHGVPIALKDFTPTMGLRTTLGSYAYEHWVPDFDPVLWQRLRAAGAILIGKTTTPEFAHSSFTESPLWGITRNPWNPERTPGGSSGGAGAAVAAGCVPLAEGTDMGGSVRIPAALCGVVGLKPSLGRIPMDILPTVFDSISHFGPLARTVEDAALFLAVTAGPHDADIQSLPAGPDPRARLEEGVAGKRLAWSPDLGFFAVAPEVRREVAAAVQALGEAGAVVEEVKLPWDRSVMDDWALNWAVLLAACFGQHLESFRSRMTPAVVGLIEQGLARRRGRPAPARARPHAALARARAPVRALRRPALPDHGADRAAGRAHRRRLHRRRRARAAPRPGHDGALQLHRPMPGAHVPAGWSDDGLPVGLQIVGRRFDDAGVLAIGRALERIRPWRDRHPPL